MSLPILVLLVAVGALLALVAALAVLALRDPEASSRRVLALFRKARKPPKTPGRNHYYRPYWS